MMLNIMWFIPHNYDTMSNTIVTIDKHLATVQACEA